MTDTIKFDIRGMTCDHCVHAVTEAVQGVAGVREVKVDLATNSAVVQSDGADIAKIVDAVKEEGYEAQPVAS